MSLAYAAPRRLTIVLVLLLAASMLGNAAFAKTRAKPRLTDEEPPSARAVAPRAPTPAPARFFTINQVLAKRDGRPEAETSKLASIAPTSVTTDAIAPGRGVPTDEPFGLFAFRAPEGQLWSKWRRIEHLIDDEASTIASCRVAPEDCTSPGAARFIAIVEEARRRDGRARIETVNRLVNVSVRYASDLALHGTIDWWSPPLETLAAGRGDCEDYAIAKYVALREAGAAHDDLRLLLVRDRAAGQDHAVLAVRHEDRWLILDNRHGMLNEATELPHFTPLFTLGHAGVKLFAAPYGAIGPRPSETAGETALAAAPASRRPIVADETENAARQAGADTLRGSLAPFDREPWSLRGALAM